MSHLCRVQYSSPDSYTNLVACLAIAWPDRPFSGALLLGPQLCLRPVKRQWRDGVILYIRKWLGDGCQLTAGRHNTKPYGLRPRRINKAVSPTVTIVNRHDYHMYSATYLYPSIGTGTKVAGCHSELVYHLGGNHCIPLTRDLGCNSKRPSDINT